MTHIDAGDLLETARRLDAVITVDTQLGAFVADGQPVARAWGVEHLSAQDERQIRRQIWLSPERQLRQEIGFGLRQLVDIAERALSPASTTPPRPCRSSIRSTGSCASW